MDKFASMTELLGCVSPDGNYVFHIDERRRSRVKLFAPHGGCIEPCTGNLAIEIASGVYDYYIFQGMMKKDCFRTLHVTSTHYNEPRCRTMAEEALVAVAIHGCDGEKSFIELGGGNRILAFNLQQHLLKKGYTAIEAPIHRRGEDESNFINKARFKGIQLELSSGFRRSLFPSFPKVLQRHPITLPAFVSALREWIDSVEASLVKNENHDGMHNILP
jgi:phage replication-related protein YjqB (UPF0714/DUF867 family)